MNIVRAIILLILVFGFSSAKANWVDVLNQLPEYEINNDIQNDEWFNEEQVEVLNYSGHIMELGISPDGEYLLFNDKNEPNKDIHWSKRINDRIYEYQGKVQNTVSKKVDAAPSFDGLGNIYFTSLKAYSGNSQSIFVSKFQDGIAVDPVLVDGNIYVKKQNKPFMVWISLDPDVTDDGKLMFYSEGRFDPRAGFPYPFNVRGAERVNGQFLKIKDEILKNINTNNLEYAPAISSDGLEIFFTRIAKVNGQPKMLGIYTAKRSSIYEPFSSPGKIMAITGDVEAPVLSGDENYLYYHRRYQGKFKAYRVTRKIMNN